LPNGVEAVEAILGVSKSNRAILAMNARHTDEEHSFVLNDSGTETIIFGKEFWTR